jgi:BirA family transcriptional regulator, biotin operon repressor / biotin---[acetyl-CoA-carboxylase] ligase
MMNFNRYLIINRKITKIVPQNFIFSSITKDLHLNHKADICLMNGPEVHYFESLPSTNALALEWIAKTRPPEGTMIYTGHQTAGRGQFGSIWESEADKNVLMSVIMYPEFIEPSRLFLLQMVCSVTLLDIVKSWLPDIQFCLKWPNDLMAGDSKLAGLLLQTGIRGNKLDYAVLGIGLNVHQQEFPTHLPLATSLSNLGYAGQTISSLTLHIREAIMNAYCSMANTDSWIESTAKWHQKYESALCWKGQPRQIFPKDKDPFQGIIKGVTEQGQLSVSKAPEEIFYYWPREVKTAPLTNLT